ncbi:MAG: VWA domain-containing protein [Elusimicrobia bacterium]|nr:VWA domain-containing protein [Elusimicrobiota bacterium]MDE2425864.1 VWA domain-containing protein [Elusimicrobiota bacterium]
MRFAYPWVLCLSLPALAAAWWALTFGERRRHRLPYPAAGALAGAAASAWPAARWMPAALRAAALLLVAMALARPQRVTSSLGASGQGIDIMLLLDMSPSMAANDVDPSRAEAAKQTARRFVLARAQDRIGLVAFGGASELLCPLTLDYDALLSQLAALSPGMTMVDGTAIGDGIISAVNHLKAGSAKTKIAILLTDGRSNTGLIDPLTAAKAAATMGVKVYTIGIGGRGPAQVSYMDPQRGLVQGVVDDDLDEETLNSIASVTGARYFRATSLKQLRSVYAAIDTLEKSKIKLPPVVSRDDLYQPFALTALLLLLAETMLGATLWLRWP